MGTTKCKKFHDTPSEKFIKQVKAAAACSGLRNAPSIIFTFDDGTQDHLQAADILRENGLRGIFFINPDTLGGKGFLNEVQIRKIARDGHIIGSHGMTHQRLDRMPTKTARWEVQASHSALERICGRSVTWFAPVGGILPRYLKSDIKETGYSHFRTMQWGYAVTPPTFEVSCFPVTGHVNRTGFQKILAGKALTWPYYAKELFKTIFGEAGYQKLRQAFMS